MVKSHQKFHNRGGGPKFLEFPKFKNFPSKGGGSQNLGTDPKLYLVIIYEGFPKRQSNGMTEGNDHRVQSNKNNFANVYLNQVITLSLIAYLSRHNTL